MPRDHDAHIKYLAHRNFPNLYLAFNNQVTVHDLEKMLQDRGLLSRIHTSFDMWDDTEIKLEWAEFYAPHRPPVRASLVKGPARGLFVTSERFHEHTRVKVHGFVNFNGPVLKKIGRPSDVVLRFDRRANPRVRGKVEVRIPLSASGRFEIVDDLFFFSPRPRMLEGSVATANDDVVTRFVLQFADCEGFVTQFIAPWEAAALTRGAPPLEFLDSVRQVLLSAPLFKAAIGRFSDNKPLVPPKSFEGKQMNAYKTLRVGDELVDISHVLTGIEAAKRQKPGPKVPIQGWRVDLYLTWVGDLGTAVREWGYQQYYVKPAAAAGHHPTRPPIFSGSLQKWLEARAGPEELRGDIDGVNLGELYDPAVPLSRTLGRYCAGKYTKRRFHDFLENTLTDAGEPALKLDGKGLLTEGSLDFIAEYIVKFVNQSLVASLDKDRRAFIRESFGDDNYFPEGMSDLLKPDSPKVRQAARYFADFVEEGIAGEKK